MPEHVVVLMTCGNAQEADKIAEALVTEKLAACVNIVSPVRSFYMWENQLHKDEEWLLIAKTRSERLTQLERKVKALHSYKVPEIIALPIETGSESYLKWVTRMTPHCPK